MPKHTDIPSIVYDNLRSVAESQVRRQLEPEAVIGLNMPHLTNADIFLMMPDHRELQWDETCQPAIMAVTLERMCVEIGDQIA